MTITGDALQSMDFRLDPWPVWRELRYEQPVFFNELTNSWLVTRYDDVVAVFADNEHFSNQLYAKSLGVVFGPTMLQFDGAEHVALRKIVSPEFVGNRLAGYFDVIEAESAALIATFGEGPIELVKAFTNRMPVNVIVTMLGMPGDEHDRFHDWYSTMMAGLVFGKPERTQAGIEAHQALAQHVGPSIEERAGCPMGDLISKIVHAEDYEWVTNGTNTDDLGDFRPGLDAAKQYGVRSPLVEAELTKAEIRSLSKDMDLPTWDKPAQACLSSRIPYGTPVSVEALTRIAKAEEFLRDLGIGQLRVRHHGSVARIEVTPADFPALLDEEVRESIGQRFRSIGYAYVTLDLEGFRSGSMNEVLTSDTKKRATSRAND